MTTYSNTRELKQDVLFRASEPIDGSSDWETKVIDYLNRVYRTICAGASEFLPEYVEDWWWMRGQGVFLLEPAYVAGTVTVVQGSDAISFSTSPAISLVGRRLRVTDETDVPLIATHVAATNVATLDTVWTGNSVTQSFKAMLVDYSLPVTVQALISPIVIFQRPEQISGMSPERMDLEWPLARLDTGIPQAFALQNENQVRFSHGGSDVGFQHRLEYRYRAQVVDLTDSVMSIPLVPSQWRHLLADMALTYVLIDKNDDRSNAVALGARTGLAAMLKDNRRRNTKIDAKSGHIRTRPTNIRTNLWGRRF